MAHTSKEILSTFDTFVHETETPYQFVSRGNSFFQAFGDEFEKVNDFSPAKADPNLEYRSPAKGEKGEWTTFVNYGQKVVGITYNLIRGETTEPQIVLVAAFSEQHEICGNRASCDVTSKKKVTTPVLVALKNHLSL